MTSKERLEQYIKEDDLKVSKETLEEILSKYKEIIGGKNE